MSWNLEAVGDKWAQSHLLGSARMEAKLLLLRPPRVSASSVTGIDWVQGQEGELLVVKMKVHLPPVCTTEIGDVSLQIRRWSRKTVAHSQLGKVS